MVMLIVVTAIGIPTSGSAATAPSITVPVLMYHYIRPLAGLDATGRSLSVSPEHFQSQMEQLVQDGYHAITPAQLDAALTYGTPLPQKPILITFDDGYYDQIQNALPILVRLHLPATFFIISGWVNRYGYMYAPTLRMADATGLVTIAAHTQHHADLPALSPQRAFEEILGSKADLERILGHRVSYFAYPYGAFSPSVENDVRDAGFRLAFTTIGGDRQSPQSRYLLERERVHDASTIAWLR